MRLSLRTSRMIKPLDSCWPLSSSVTGSFGLRSSADDYAVSEMRGTSGTKAHAPAVVVGSQREIFKRILLLLLQFSQIDNQRLNAST